MAAVDDGGGHDTGELEEMLGGIQRRLRMIVEQDQLAELIRIWKQPGWTTPAEWFLIREALGTIDAQVGQLERAVEVVLRGSDMVGRQ